MQNYICEGETIEVTAGGAIASGDPVLSGSIFGIATNSAASGDVVAVRRKGVYTLAKATGTAWSIGDKLFWDAAEAELTKTALGNTPAGFAYSAAGSGDATGLVLLASNQGYKQAAVVAALGSTTNLTAIAGSYADLAAARTSVNTLAGEVEARLDALDAKVDAILTSLKAAGAMAAS
jgi:predicted RecA/RadA family phage recombinase